MKKIILHSIDEAIDRQLLTSQDLKEIHREFNRFIEKALKMESRQTLRVHHEYHGCRLVASTTKKVS